MTGAQGVGGSNSGLVGQSKVAPASALLGTIGSLAAFCGPPLAGLIIVAAGPPAVFVLEAVLIALAAFLVLIWRRRSPDHRLPAEHLVNAMRLGLWCARYAGPFRSLLIRADSFTLTPSGKIQKHVLRNQLAAAASV